MHADPDEIRLAPSTNQTLAEAISEVDKEGYNAINFMEYTFLPLRESPDHDYSNFQETMLLYYPYGKRHPHRLNAWEKQPRRWPRIKAFARELIKNQRFGLPSVNLTASGGHLVNFPSIKPYPINFKHKHYLVLSLKHAIQKYVKNDFDPRETSGTHGLRATASEYDFSFFLYNIRCASSYLMTNLMQLIQ